MAGNREFFNRRLHSLLGVIPVGIFLIQHLIVNHFAVYGASSFNQAAHFMEGLPFRYALELLIIFIPLLYHAIYGLYIAFQGKSNTRRYGIFVTGCFYFKESLEYSFLFSLRGTYGKREYKPLWAWK